MFLFCFDLFEDLLQAGIQVFAVVCAADNVGEVFIDVNCLALPKGFI